MAIVFEVKVKCDRRSEKKRCMCSLQALELSLTIVCMSSFLPWEHFVKSSWNRREGGRVQPLKEWQSLWGCDKPWVGSARSLMVDDLTFSRPWASLYPHCNTLHAKWHAHKHHDCSRPKGPKSGRWPNFWKPHPSPEIVRIILPLISLWNYPAHKNSPPHISGPLTFWDGPHSFCGVCLSQGCSLLPFEIDHTLSISQKNPLIYHFASCKIPSVLI